MSGGDIGWARTELARGQRVRRAGWNGKGMWLALVPSTNNKFVDWAESRGFDLLPWVGMKTADDKFVPWLCSQTDFLALDWEHAD